MNVVHEVAIPSRMAADFARQIEDGIDAMAAELAAVCRWSTPNPLVEALGAGGTGRASVFRKSAEASLGRRRRAAERRLAYLGRPARGSHDRVVDDPPAELLRCATAGAGYTPGRRVETPTPAHPRRRTP